MKITIHVASYIVEPESDQEVSASDSIRNWRFVNDDPLANYLDADMADMGIVGGEVRAVVIPPNIELCVDFWCGTRLDDMVLRRLSEYVCAQMDDGVGEGGFPARMDGKDLRILANTEEETCIEVTDDGALFQVHRE